MMVIVVVVFSVFSLNAQEQNAIYGGLGSAKKWEATETNIYGAEVLNLVFD
jgi:hypothetical protein